MKLNPHLEVILAAIIWGSTGVFIKYLSLPPSTLALFRMGVPTIIIGIYFIVKKINPFHSKIKIMVSMSALNAFRVFIYYIGFTYTSIGNAVIILYTWPIFATIFSIIILKEKISKRNTILLLLAFVGIIITYLNKDISFGNKDFIGMTAMLLTASISAYITVIFKKESSSYSKFEIIFYQNLVGVFVFLPLFFINKPFPTTTQISVATIYATLIGIVGFTLFFSALKKLKASTASFLSYIEVISAIIFGMVLFNEMPTWNVLVGGGMIIIATIFMRR